ncbi:MAG: hypothetical protein RJA36_2470 [Pseudomonadota bacterium]|jgi:hypothetical protein
MTANAARCRQLWLASLLALAGAAHADELYRCQAYGGGKFWSREPCQQHGALVDRIVSVPSGLSLDRQIRVAEQGARETEGRARQAVAGTRSEQDAVRREQRAAERQRARCARLDADLARQDSRSRQKHTARLQERIRERQQMLREDRERAGC